MVHFGDGIALVEFVLNREIPQIGLAEAERARLRLELALPGLLPMPRSWLRPLEYYVG